MDRIDEFNKKLAQLDRSDPIQIQAMIDLIGEWLEDKTNAAEIQAHLTAVRTHLWLDFWELTKDSQSLENTTNHLATLIESYRLIYEDIRAIERVFNIFGAIYTTSKDSQTLEMAVYWGTNYYDFATIDFPNYIENTNNLADVLRERYSLRGEAEDLSQSIELFEETLELTPEGDDSRPMLLNNLAGVLRESYSLRGKTEDLDKSIKLLEEALELTPEGDEARSMLVNNLTLALGDRYDLIGKVEDLDQGIELLEEALAVSPEGDKYRTLLLNRLADVLRESYSLRGKTEDLDQSIELFEETLELTPEGDQVWHVLLTNLAITLRDRYALRGMAQDLDQSIKLVEEAVTMTPEGHEDRPAILDELALTLRDRYVLRGKAEDLDKSIELLEEALKLTPEATVNRHRLLDNLANALRDRYALRAKAQDLDQSIELFEEALALTLEGDIDRPGSLNNLALALRDSFELGGKIQDLDRSIELFEEALVLTPERKIVRPMLLNNLALALGDRYALRGKAEDLDKRIELNEEALRLTSEGDKDRPMLLNNLAVALEDCYVYSTIDDDAIKAREYYQLAIELLIDGHIQKPKFQRNLGHFSMRMGDYSNALEAYEGMAANLEMLRSASPSKQDREKLLSDYSYGFANLVFCCLKLNQPEKALRYAEGAKSRALVDALHNQVTDISNLATQDDSLKANLKELQKLQHEINWLLKQLGAGDENISWMDPNTARFKRSPDEINADLRDKRAKEQELWQMLEKRAPVFAMTVSAPPFYLQDAVALADEENATLINYYQHSQGWVAFVVHKSELNIAELQGVEELLEHYQSAFSNLHSPFGKKLLSSVLEEAWQVLIQPLKKWLPAEGSNLVIAPFAGLHHLPFAAFTNPTDGSYLVDRFHLKEATSLGTLKAMRTQAQIGAESHANAHAMTVVGYADKPSSPSYLPAVEDEVNAISNLFHLPHPLIGQAAMIENVLTQAPGSQSLHFACHGMFDPQEPQRSGLMLEDGWLTVRDVLTRMNLSGTELVVMSACLSGLTKISQGEELTGLLTAFISARAKSVVGSLWSVDDRSTAELMVRFYELISQGWERSAALREAQLSIRKQPQWGHPYYWSPFLLTGVG
jgi:CHAT domain-containing protein